MKRRIVINMAGFAVMVVVTRLLYVTDYKEISNIFFNYLNTANLWAHGLIQQTPNVGIWWIAPLMACTWIATLHYDGKPVHRKKKAINILLWVWAIFNIIILFRIFCQKMLTNSLLAVIDSTYMLLAFIFIVALVLIPVIIIAGLYVGSFYLLAYKK